MNERKPRPQEDRQTQKWSLGCIQETDPYYLQFHLTTKKKKKEKKKKKNVINNNKINYCGPCVFNR